MRLAIRTATVVLALVLAGCGGAERQSPSEPQPPPRIGSRSLMGTLQVDASPDAPSKVGEGASAIDLRNLTHVSIESSEREAVVTTSGVRWSTGVELPRNAILKFTIAGRGETASAVMTLETPGKTREIFSGKLDESQQWTAERVEVGNAEPMAGTIVLESDAPAAWGELYLSPVEVEARGPNLVLVIIDTLRADHLGFAGYERPTSPNLDRLAGESYVFTRARSASTWTLPSTASLLTGLFPDQHGVKIVNNRLAGSVLTLAERLRAKGYRTAAFTDGGFVSPEWGFGQGFERFDSTPGPSWIPKDLEHGFDVARVTAEATTWIEADPGRPFFILVHTYEPHEPYGNVEGFADPFLSPDVKGDARKYGHATSLMNEVDAAELARLEALYDGGIARADHYIGRFFDRLRQRGAWSDTAVIVTSDHGEEFQEHGTLEHGLGKVFDENVRVPLVLKPPRTMERRNVELPANGIDVAPTFLALAGVGPDPGLPGRSLIDVADRSLDRLDLVEGFNTYPSLHENKVRLDRDLRALVVDRVHGGEAIYDLSRDPGMQKPAPPKPSEPLGDDLQAILAWTAPGELAVRLPDDVRTIETSRDSMVVPVGVWRRYKYRTIDGRGPIDLGDAAPGPTVLVFNAAKKRGRWSATIAVGNGEPAPVELGSRTPDGRSTIDWRPLDDTVPPLLHYFGTAPRFEARTSPLTPEEEAKLRALGYLQ